MQHITVQTMRKLQSVGFCYPEYEGFLNYGMVFNYQGDDFYIGGLSGTPLGKELHWISTDGVWLPDSEQLLNWLQMANFNVSVQIDAKTLAFSILAIDNENGAQYEAEAFNLVQCAANVVYKICKSQKRLYIPKSRLRIEIDDA